MYFMNECDFCQDRYLVGKTNLTSLFKLPTILYAQLEVEVQQHLENIC